MRKFLVKHFVAVYSIRIFGVTLTALRCTRFGFPLFLLLILFLMLFHDYHHHWALIPLLVCAGLFILYAWITFSWCGLGYFQLWPVKPEEYEWIPGYGEIDEG